MTQEEKQLLLIDLCARLPYGVKIRIEYPFVEEKYWHPEDLCGLDLRRQVIADTSIRIEEFKPYLRPISSMTEDELNECVEQSGIRDVECPNWRSLPKEKHFEARLNHSANMFLVDSRTIQWLNAHHFDYHRLIESGLALEATKDMYKN